MDVRCFLKTLGTGKCFNEFFYMNSDFDGYTTDANLFIDTRAQNLRDFIAQIERSTDLPNATTAKHFVKMVVNVEHSSAEMFTALDRAWCLRERRRLARVGAHVYTQEAFQFIKDEAKILTEIASLFSCTRKESALLGLMVILSFLVRLGDHNERLEAKRQNALAKQA